MHQVYLSRRNLHALLSKLDRCARGERTECAIIKTDVDHPKFKQSMSAIFVEAVEDDEYYVDRPPGPMVEQEEQASADREELLALLSELKHEHGEYHVERIEAILRRLHVT